MLSIYIRLIPSL